MLSLTEAVRAAEALLEAQATEADARWVVVSAEMTGGRWAFGYQSERWMRTRAVADLRDDDLPVLVDEEGRASFADPPVPEGLRPLTPFVSPPGGDLDVDELRARVGQVPAADRERVASYLRRAPVFLDWMGHAVDLLGDKFGVPGGYSVASDGVWFWRLDAAEYVEFYGIRPPAEALDHMASRRWEPPQLEESDPAWLEIYQRLSAG